MNLFPYQQKAVEFIAEKKKVYLALDMGMGKTLTSLASAYQNGKKHILLIAEKNEIVNSENFKKEVETHFPDLTYYSLRDTDLTFTKVGKPSVEGSMRAVCGINPDGLAKHSLKDILRLFDSVVIDEATLAKTTTTDRFKRVQKVCKEMEYISLLSGTPMMNGSAELYAPLLLLEHPMVAGKGAGAKKAFEAVFAGGHYRKIKNTGRFWLDYTWWAKGANYVRELRYLINEHFFFMLKGDTDVFKKKTRTLRRVPMGMQWLAEYTQAWDKYYDEAKTRNVDLKNARELQNLIENGQCYQVNSRWKAKQVVQDIADGVYGKKRIIIFSMFLETDEVLQSELEGHGITFKTFDEVKEYKAGTEQVLVGRIKAHGKGGNIPEASVCLFVDMDFVPSNNIQAENRIDRPEQKNDMDIVYYITEGDDVVDAHVRAINQDKARKIEKFMQPLTKEEVEDMPRLLGLMRIKHAKDMAILGI